MSDKTISNANTVLDLDFVFGVIEVGFLADLFGARLLINSIAWRVLASGILIFTVMRETYESVVITFD